MRFQATLAQLARALRICGAHCSGNDTAFGRRSRCSALRRNAQYTGYLSQPNFSLCIPSAMCDRQCLWECKGVNLPVRRAWSRYRRPAWRSTSTRHSRNRQLDLAHISSFQVGARIDVPIFMGASQLARSHALPKSAGNRVLPPVCSLARLLLRKVADDGQLEHLALVRLQQQDDPDNQRSQCNQQVQRSGNQN